MVPMVVTQTLNPSVGTTTVGLVAEYLSEDGKPVFIR